MSCSCVLADFRRRNSKECWLYRIYAKKHSFECFSDETVQVYTCATVHCSVSHLKPLERKGTYSRMTFIGYIKGVDQSLLGCVLHSSSTACRGKFCTHTMSFGGPPMNSSLPYPSLASLIYAIFTSVANAWVGQKWSKTVALQCDLIAQNWYLECPCRAQKWSCKRFGVQSLPEREIWWWIEVIAVDNVRNEADDTRHTSKTSRKQNRGIIHG